MTPDVEAGEELRRHMLGEAWVDDWNQNTDAFDAAFKEFSVRISFGEVWLRPGLDLRARSLITVAVLMATGQREALGWHLRGALANGVTMEELSEALLHCSLYTGIPPGVVAFQIADEVLGNQ